MYFQWAGFQPAVRAFAGPSLRHALRGRQLNARDLMSEGQHWRYKKHQVRSGKRHFHGQLRTNKKVTKFNASIMTPAAYHLNSTSRINGWLQKVPSNTLTPIKRGSEILISAGRKTLTLWMSNAFLVCVRPHQLHDHEKGTVFEGYHTHKRLQG